MDVNSILWSWSRVNSFASALKGDGCAFGWYKTYLEDDRGENNFFGEAGTLIHSLIEGYNNGEIMPWEIQDKFILEYNNLKYNPPRESTKEKYLNQLTEFFDASNIAKWFEDYDIVASEMEVEFKISDYTFRGFIDMVANHKKYGLVILDIKSANPYEGKKLEHNIMQLYCYSIGIKEKMGKYPDNLIFFYPRESVKESVHKFNINKLAETKEFCINTIEKLKEYTSKDMFKPRCASCDKNDFYANVLCNHRLSCEYKLK